MSDIYEFKVAWGKICDQGWVTIAKDIVTKEYNVVCEECESEWDHPLHAQFNINIKEYNERHLVMMPSSKEIQKLGWSKYIIKD